jgi:hypothetical protein
LQLAISGALGVAAGSELLSGLGHLVEKTKNLSHELVQLQKIGLSNVDIARIHEEAIRITRTVPGTTELEALRIPGQTYSMLGLENSLKIAEDLAKFHNATRKTTPAARSWPAEQIKYAIRLPANRVLQDRIGYLLKRPVGRPPNEVRRFHANFTYQAGSWTKPRRVIAKVEWHPSELYPRIGFIATNLSRPAERVAAFYNKRGTAEQWIKEGKGAIKWTRCRAGQMAEVAIPRQMFQEILRLIAELRPQPLPAPA